jgi:hypothetical protein
MEEGREEGEKGVLHEAVFYSQNRQVYKNAEFYMLKQVVHIMTTWL